MSRKIIDTTLRDSFLERIKKPGCPSVKTIAEEMGLPKATLYSWIADGGNREEQTHLRGGDELRQGITKSRLTPAFLVLKIAEVKTQVCILLIENFPVAFFFSVSAHDTFCILHLVDVVTDAVYRDVSNNFD